MSLLLKYAHATTKKKCVPRMRQTLKSEDEHVHFLSSFQQFFVNTKKFLRLLKTIRSDKLNRHYITENTLAIDEEEKEED
jgi:hypothetical protein